MPAPDVLDTLRGHDPAAGLAPADADARERLRRAIVAEPVASEPGKRSRRRGRLVLVAAALALVLSAAAWGLYSGSLDTPETVRREFDEVTRSIPLPPGTTWEEPYLPEGLYGEEAGLSIAQHQATCAWFEYWNQGNAAQRVEALAGFERVRATMTPRRPGAFEEEPGYSKDMLRWYDSLLADMKRGEPTEIRQYLRANCE